MAAFALNISMTAAFSRSDHVQMYRDTLSSVRDAWAVAGFGILRLPITLFYVSVWPSRITGKQK